MTFRYSENDKNQQQMLFVWFADDFVILLQLLFKHQSFNTLSASHHVILQLNVDVF